MKHSSNNDNNNEYASMDGLDGPADTDDASPSLPAETACFLIATRIAVLACGCLLALFVLAWASFGVFAVDDPNAGLGAQVFAYVWFYGFGLLALVIFMGTLAATVTGNGAWMVPCLWPFAARQRNDQRRQNGGIDAATRTSPTKRSVEPESALS